MGPLIGLVIIAVPVGTALWLLWHPKRWQVEYSYDGRPQFPWNERGKLYRSRFLANCYRRRRSRYSGSYWRVRDTR